MALEHKLLRRRPSVARLFQHCGIALIPSTVRSTMLRPHAHDVHEALLVRKGHLRHDIAGYQLDSAEDTLDLVPQDIGHRYQQLDKTVEIVNILIDPKLILDHDNPTHQLFTKQARICQIDLSTSSTELWYHIDHILLEQKQQKISWEQSIPLHFRQILLICERAIYHNKIIWFDQNEHTANHARLNQLLQQIEHQPQLHWTLKRMAKELGLSKEHVCRRFQQRVQCSPIDYVRQQRMSVVQLQMLHHNRSVAEAAQIAGFSSALSCYRSFQKYLGMSPTDWLRQERPSVGR